MADGHVSHPRVLNRHHGPPVKGPVYVGRGSPWGNPYPRSEREPMRRFLGYVRDHPRLVERARRELRGKLLLCSCAPALCHAVVWARLADGEDLAAIEADIVSSLPPEQLGLFGP